MFVILRLNEAPKGILKKRKQRKKLANSQPIAMQTERGLPYFMLDIPSVPNDTAWNNITEKCGRYASRIVAPRSLTLPDRGSLKRFVPYSMASILIFNTSKEIIGKANHPPEEISVTVTDRNALHTSRICELLPFASTVRIITTHPERYARACEKAFDEYGASLIVRSSYEPISKPDVVICCDGVLSPAMQTAAIFSCKHKTHGKIHFCGNGIDLTPQHKEFIPYNIDPVDFAGALTELCGSPEYKSSVFSRLETSCSLCENPLPENCLKCYTEGKL